jgi:hypothetical protein
MVHVAPTCAGSGEGYDHFESYARSLFLHFYKRLFPALEPMTSWSQDNSFTAAPGLPFLYNIHINGRNIDVYKTFLCHMY